MLDRTVPPPFAKEFSFSLPKPEVFQLPNGCTIVWIKGLQQQVCKIEVIMKAGKWYEATPGLAHFTISMLEKGAAEFSASQIAETFDMYGAQLELAAGPDFASASIYSLNNKLHHVLPVFSALMQAPTFPQEELDLAKDIFVENLKVNNEKTSYLASKYFKRNVFGDQHPYGSTLEIDDVHKVITASSIRKFFVRQCQPFEVYITGSLSQSQLDLITEIFSRFNNNQLESKAPVVGASDERTRHFKKQGSVQTTLRIGGQTLTRNHPDYFQFLLLNHLLGGYFGSRLMKNIREEKGLTYGIYSSVSAHRNHSLFTIGTDVNNEKADLTTNEIRKEIERLQQDNIPAQEIEVARNHFLGALQLELSNPFAVTEKIKNIRLNQLPANYYEQLITATTATDSIGLNAIAQKHLVWGDFHQVSVG
jgi:zinc protease